MVGIFHHILASLNRSKAELWHPLRQLCKDLRHFLQLARPVLICWQATHKKAKTMKNTSSTQPKATGTVKGAVISLCLIVAFGLGNYMFQQDSNTNHAAADTSFRPSIISAYLA
jgi:hypothetical protein